MTLNVGQGFKQRWLDAPEALRLGMLDELYRVCDLLSSDVSLEQWQDHDQRAMQIAQLNVEQAYATQKAELIEAARLRKQHKLEQSLTDRRQQQQDYIQQLQQDELNRQQQQNQELRLIAVQVAQESRLYSARYSANPTQTHANPHAHVNTQAQAMTASLDLNSQQRLMAEIENIRIRLELEAETLIEQTLRNFKNQLNAAVQDEVELIRAQILPDQN